jgi:hypothetical protein
MLSRGDMLTSRKKTVLVSYKDEKKKYHVSTLLNVDQIIEDIARLFLDAEQLKSKRNEGIFKLRR